MALALSCVSLPPMFRGMQRRGTEGGLRSRRALLGSLERVQIGKLDTRRFSRRNWYTDVPSQPNVTGERGCVEIGDPVLSGGQVCKIGAAAEIGYGCSDQIARLSELHDSLFKMTLMLTL